MNFEPTLIIFLFIFIAFLVVFVIFSLIYIYHIFQSASFTTVSVIASFIMFTMTVLTLYGTGYFLKDVDWKQPIFEHSNSSPELPSFPS